MLKTPPHSPTGRTVTIQATNNDVSGIEPIPGLASVLHKQLPTITSPETIDIAENRAKVGQFLICSLALLALLVAITVKHFLSSSNPTDYDNEDLFGLWYYIILTPLMVPMTTIFAYFSWMFLKFFIHN
eukprot:TRINITY_DN20940_c0_g1_i2.p1 TRINITY_DN20940_c0_g1~~TRINITY_DN20940_c0_g1_i2.p1  ORF type:complete len:129 (+),score=12.00 TRINITY_DN20940_c0_g1_i2:101-487(+)